VAIPEAIARGDGRCRVIVDLVEPAEGPTRDESEFFGRDD
jgi:hypothetical protein